MAKKISVKELENVLLDQIEKLNDDSIMDDPEKAKILRACHKNCVNGNSIRAEPAPRKGWRTGSLPAPIP